MPEWVSGFVMFLMRGIGYVVIGVVITFIASYFVKLPPNRADLFSIIEVIFAVIITALSIIASFAVSTQWREFEKNVQTYSRDIDKIAQDANKRIEVIESRHKKLIEQLEQMQESTKQMDERSKESYYITLQNQKRSEELITDIHGLIAEVKRTIPLESEKMRVGKYIVDEGLIDQYLAQKIEEKIRELI